MAICRNRGRGVRLVAVLLAPRPGPRHQGRTFNLERSGRGRPGTFQVWAPQKNLAGHVPGRTPPEFNLELHWDFVKGADSSATYRTWVYPGLDDVQVLGLRLSPDPNSAELKGPENF